MRAILFWGIKIGSKIIVRVELSKVVVVGSPPISIASLTLSGWLGFQY